MIEKIFEQILGLKEIRVERVDIKEKVIDICCSSVMEESLCPVCLKKQRKVNQTYKRKIRDLSVTGKEVYLYLTVRQFYCPDCNRHFTEPFSFVDPSRTMTVRYEEYIYNLCKISTMQKVSAQENIVWNCLDDIFRRYAKKELAGQSSYMTRVVGMDEFAVKKGHKNFATVIVDLERVQIIDILEYREKDKLVSYFKGKGEEWLGNIEVFCSDMWDGFISTAKAVFPNAAIVVDRFHFFWHLNKAVDNQRKHLRRVFKEHEEFKHLKWALIKNQNDLTAEEKKKSDSAFILAPELKQIYEHKEQLRAIFEEDLSKKQAELKINKWIESAESLNNKYLNLFIKTFNNWKDYVLNYFISRFTTSIIEGVNNSIKTVKRMCFGFRNFENFKTRIMLNFI